MMTPSEESRRVTVVGGGIIGVSCAHYLNKAGFAVTVVERGTVCGACSAGNCGYICPSHVLPLTEPGAVKAGLKSLFSPSAPFRVKPRFSPSLWNWMWQFAKRCNERQMLTAGVHLKAILDSSMSEYRRLIAEESLDCEWKETGLLYVLRTAHGMEEFAKNDAFLREHFGVGARRMEGSELPAFDPALKAGLAGGFHYDCDASLRPDLLGQQWSQRLKERGVNFIEQCALTGIEKTGGRIDRLRTANGEMPAGRVVFATGAWSAHLARDLACRIPIQPGKGYSVTMARPDPCPRYPILFPEHRVGVSPFEKGYRLGSIMEFAGYDSSIPPQRIQQLRDSARHYLVDPSPAGPEQPWYGWRPMTWDSLPIIGRVPGLDNAYLATGHNMLGMSLATATGRLVAEMVQGTTPHIDPSAYSPERFN